MYPVTPLYLKTIRSGARTRFTATHRNPFTHVTTDLPIVDGSVTDDANADVRRVLSITLPAQQKLLDVLSVPGGEITITQIVRYIDRTVETVPMGVFVVDQDAFDYAPNGDLTMTCPDRWVIVQRNRFGATGRASIPTNQGWQEIKRLVEGAFPNAAYPFPGWASTPDTSASAKVGNVAWLDGSRASAVKAIATAASVEVFFNRTGKAVLRPIPVLTSSTSPVFTVDAGQKGVMLGASRVRDMSRTRNAVIVTSTATDVVMAPVTVKNSNPADQLSTVGPLGFVPFYFASPVVRNSTQARAAGVTKLSKQLGVAQQLSLVSEPNRALDSGDVLGVLLPQIDRTTAREFELHIIDKIVHPFLPTGTQTIDTRSTRPTSDDSDGS